MSGAVIGATLASDVATRTGAGVGAVAAVLTYRPDAAVSPATNATVDPSAVRLGIPTTVDPAGGATATGAVGGPT